MLFIGAHLRPAARQPPSLRTLQVSCFRLSSNLRDCPPTDLFIHLQSKSSWNALGVQIANFGPVLWKPFSRGRVSLSRRAGTRWSNSTSSPTSAIWRASSSASAGPPSCSSSEAMRALCGQPFPVRFTDRLRRLNQKTRANAWKASVVARLLNLSPALSDTGLRLLTGGARPLADLIADDEQLAEHVAPQRRRHLPCQRHRAAWARATIRTRSSIRQGRVHGIAGLRVADASVMPTVPRGNTNLPTIMIAEKLAAAMLAN